MSPTPTPSVLDDAPALAGALVVHAQKLCEEADRLWRILSNFSIPTEPLTDHRREASLKFDTESMVRVYLYQEIYDLAQSEVADRLQDRPSLLKGLGLDRPPTQQNISYAWRQFTHRTKTTLDAAATGIALVAVENGVIMRARVPILPDEDDTDQEQEESTATREYVREHGTKLVELARRHAFSEFDSHRADNTVYEDEQILDLFSSACLTQVSAHSEGEAGWFLDDHDRRERCSDHPRNRGRQGTLRVGTRRRTR